MIPQLIWIVLFMINLVIAGYNHGKPKTGKHDMSVSILAAITTALLLYWGGFFDCLFIR